MLLTPRGSPESSVLCSGRSCPFTEKMDSSPFGAMHSCDQGLLRSIPVRSGAADVRWGHQFASPLRFPPRTSQQSLFLANSFFPAPFPAGHIKMAFEKKKKKNLS